MYLLILFILLLLLLLYYPLHDIYLIYIRGAPPGPISLPLIGGLHQLNPRTPHFSVEDLFKKYGKIFSLRMGPFGRAVFVGSLKTIDEVFSKRELRNRPRLPFMDIISKGADGIGSCKFDGEKWKYLTRILTQGQAKFSNANLTKQAVPYLTQLMDRFEENTDNSYNPCNDIAKACAAIFSSVVYGIRSESLDSDDLQSRMVYHTEIMSGLNMTHILNILPSIWNIPSPLKTKIQDCIQHRDCLMEKYLQLHIDQFDGEYKDMMDIVANSVLYHAALTEKNNVSVKDLLLSIWAYYLAGCDTTAHTVSWMLLYACLNKDVQEQIQQELDSVLTDEDSTILDKKPYLHYTRAFIFESMRLSSTLPLGIPSYSIKETELSGYYIPKDTIIMPTQWTIHHDPTYWPDPFKLKPERFLDQDGKLFSHQHVFKKMPFIPFSRGLRTCLGQYVALDILLMFTCMILKTYNVCFPENFTPDLKGYIVLNLQPNEFQVVFKRRN